MRKRIITGMKSNWRKIAAVWIVFLVLVMSFTYQKYTKLILSDLDWKYTKMTLSDLDRKYSKMTQNDFNFLKSQFVSGLNTGLKHCRNYTRYDSEIIEKTLFKRDVITASTKIKSEIKIIFIDAINKTFIESVNHLATEASTDGLDYILLTNRNTYNILKERNWNGKFVQILMNHVVPNIGVVVPAISNDNEADKMQFLFFHISHFKIFESAFPKKLRFESAMHWIKDVYSPFHITELNIEKLEEYTFRSIKYEVGKSIKDSSLQHDKKRINDYIYYKAPIAVLSYSFYGSDIRYTDGAEANVKLVKKFYPNWKMWIFHDDSVPLSILSKICVQYHVTCIDMTECVLKNRMCWRFLVASVPFIARYIIRDIDSRLSWREKAAVTEWLLSFKKFHVMRDHPSHSHYSISGGMWGGTRDAVPNMEELLLNLTMTDSYMKDMNFLGEVIWPIAVKSLFQHDSFSCTRFGGGYTFPTRRIGWEHIGSVYINGKMRESDVIVLKETPPSKLCTCSFVTI